MMKGSRPRPVLLNDEQVQEFIAEGFIKVNLSLPADVHEAIARKLDAMLDRGPNLGNNVLAHTPEFRHVLNAPEVRGALISLIGEDYIEHPHRFSHSMPPADEVPGDIAAAVGQHCHQDSYTPMGRPRQHYPRYARIIYYPRETPIEQGPTHVTPGTQFHKQVTDEDRAAAIPMDGPAGSLWITHFDIIHAAGINVTNATRHMIKFIFMRRNEPTSPAWICDSQRWHNPQGLRTPWDLELVWSHIWDWMCGKRDCYESFRSGNGVAKTGSVSQLIATLNEGCPVDEVLASIRQLAALGAQAADAIPTLADLLNTGHPAVRTAATYALGAIGEPAVATLVARLEEAGHVSSEQGAQASWNEGRVQMLDEAHALSAVGRAAVAPLIEVVESTGEWGRINATFALGEMDSRAEAAVPALARCLDHASHRVVRSALDALGTIGGAAEDYVPRMRRFLVESRPDWEEVLTGKRTWVARDQIRVNVATAMARLGGDAASAESELVRAMEDPCGYVGLLATDALLHLDSPTAKQAALDMIMAQRWDSSLYPERPW